MRKALLLKFIFISFFTQAQAQNIGIGTNSPQAALDVSSTTNGFLPPRMTYAQRNAIQNPVAGLMVYCTDCNIIGQMQYFNGNNWMDMTIGPAASSVEVVTSPITAFSYYTASLGGTVSATNISTISSKGVCWSLDHNPTIALNSKTIDGTGAGTFFSNVAGLLPNTTYYVRAYATNSMGTVYGNELSFTTLATNIPLVATNNVTSITTNSATCGGNVTDSSGLSVASRGVCWSASSNPTVELTTKTINGVGIGTFSSSITGLLPSTTYYVRAYAINSDGVSYGVEYSFTTAALTTAFLSTSEVNNITINSAVCGGTITNDGGSNVAFRGVCWDTLANPTIVKAKTIDGSGTGTFVSNLIGLLPGKTYYVRAYAVNDVGTSYGEQKIFLTPNAVNLPSVTIGSQIWSSKNLDVATYRNGDPIPQVTDNNLWANLTTGAWCWYNNDSATYAATYGRLYNWYAVNDPRGLAPQGWHVPTDAEWNKLIKYLDPSTDTSVNGYQYTFAGGTMKQSGTSLWTSPNTGANNSSGFLGLPGGWRNQDGFFNNLRDQGRWWSSSQYNLFNSWGRILYNYVDGVDRLYQHKNSAYSVRIIKD